MKTHYATIHDKGAGTKKGVKWEAEKTFCRTNTTHKNSKFSVTRDQELVDCCACQSKLTYQRRCAIDHSKLTPMPKSNRTTLIKTAQNLIGEAAQLLEKATGGTDFNYAHYGEHLIFKSTDLLKKVNLGLNNTIKDIEKQT